VRDGSELNSPLIDRFCNTRTEVDVHSNGQHMLIEMVTDGQKQSHGFAATFAFVSSTSSSPSSSSAKNNDGPAHPPPLLTPPTGAKTRDDRLYQPDDGRLMSYCFSRWISMAIATCIVSCELYSHAFGANFMFGAVFLVVHFLVVHCT
jgi:hypothetical protein